MGEREREIKIRVTERLIDVDGSGKQTYSGFVGEALRG